MTWTHVLFDLSSGLKKPITVPKGTCEDIKTHIEKTTKEAGLKVVQFKDNPPRWNSHTPATDVDDETASHVVFEHNRFIRELYGDLALWSQTPPEGETETLTPEFADAIWYGLSTLNLSYDRWSASAYIEQMGTLFQAMTKGESGGVYFGNGEETLSLRQAADVIILFSMYLDRHDVRLDLPEGRDFLATSDETLWCEKCSAPWLWEDVTIEEDENGNDFVICPGVGCDEVIFC